jgi:hypothetical protein
VIVCPPTDVAEIEAAIERLVDRKRQHGPEPTRADVPPGLDRAALTRSLVQVLDAVVGERAPEPQMAASSALDRSGRGPSA